MLKTFATTLFLVVLITGCGSSTNSPPSTETEKTPNVSTETSMETQSAAGDHHYFHKQEKPHAAEWGYKGDLGPAFWGELSPAYRLAKFGKSQSPIDLTGAVPKDLPTIEFDYHPAAIDLVYNGHTVEEKDEDGCAISFDDVNYRLKQFHFHSPSEHTVEGKHFPMEMHFVHQSTEGKVAVVALFITEGEENPSFTSLWNYLPSEENRERTSKETVDAAQFLPTDRSYFQYNGSFTTPPCTEDVVWLVLNSPIEVSPAQIARFRAVIDGNNRPVQSLNDREVVVKGK